QLDHFTDPMVDCRECKRRFRADQVDELDWTHYCPATKGNKFTIGAGEPCKHCGVRRTLCPECGKGELTAPRQFNLMFKTFMGPATSWRTTQSARWTCSTSSRWAGAS